MFKLHLFKRKPENDNEIHIILKQIKKTGDLVLKENFILKYKPFILKCVSKTTGRYVEVENCDEFSIGLLAFNEAIDTYNHGKNRNFFNFSEQVIKRRLINYFRLNRNKSSVVPFTYFEDAEFDKFEEKYLAEDQSSYFNRIETKDQMSRYEKELNEYGISFDELILSGPKHNDARQKLIEIGKTLAQNKELYKSLEKRRNIPLTELMKLVSVSQRTIERNRKFIIAVSLVYNGEFDILKEYVTGHGKGGEKYE